MFVYSWDKSSSLTLIFLESLQYMEGPLLDSLYWTKWYNDEPLQNENQSFIYYENLLLGVPRIRQLKVKSNSCKVHKDFQQEISDCFDVYNDKKEDDSMFGLINGTAWVTFMISNSCISLFKGWNVLIFIKYNLIFLQLAVPLRKGDQRVKSLGVTDHIQRSRILPRPGEDQRREYCYSEGPQRQPVAWSWNSSSFHWLHGIQCQHQSLLCCKVLDLK